MGSHGQSVIIRDTSSGLSAPVTAKGLLVDTELTLSGDVTVENVTVARDDAGAEKKLRVDGDRNTYIVTPSGTPINISGDVRLKDGDSATFADVEADSSKNALFVQSKSLASESTLADMSGDVASIDSDASDIKTAVEKLDDALDSANADEFRVHISDATTPTQKAQVYPTGAVRVSGDVNVVTADIQIGAVELKDHDSATRADIETDSGKGALFVQSESLASESTLADMSGDLTSLEGKDFATESTLSTAQGDIADIERVQEAISGDTTAIKTAVETIDDIVSGSEAQVDIVGGALQLGISGDIARVRDAVEKLDDALDSAATDELRVHVSDPTTPANRQTVYSTGAARVSGDVNIVGADIQIGAVELKDGDSDTRADIESDGTKNALYVQATDLDVRDLTSASDSVEAKQSTAADLKAQINIDTEDEVATQISGDIASIKTAVEIMDDWDESDRAMVNPVVGQAGVSANEGVLDSKTQRVTIAKDDAVATQLSGDSAAIKTAVELIEDAVGAEGTALNKGVLIQGDDGTDRQNVAVDTSGHIQVDIQSKAPAIERKESSQDLSSAALDYTTNFGAKMKFLSMLLSASEDISEGVGVQFNSITGPNYDTIVASGDLDSERDFSYIEPGELILESGDEITATCSKVGGSGTVYVTIMAESLS